MREACAVVCGLLVLPAVLMAVETVRLLRGCRYSIGEFWLLVTLAGLALGLAAKALPAEMPLPLVLLLAFAPGTAVFWGGAWGLAAADRSGVADPLARLGWLLRGLPLFGTLLVTYLGTALAVILGLGALVTGLALLPAALGVGLLAFLASRHYLPTCRLFHRLVRGDRASLLRREAGASLFQDERSAAERARRKHEGVRALILLGVLLCPPLLIVVFGVGAWRSLRRGRYTLTEFLVLGLATGQVVALAGALLPARTATIWVLLVALVAGSLVGWGGARGLELAHRLGLGLEERRRRLGLLAGWFLLPPALAWLPTAPFLMLFWNAMRERHAPGWPLGLAPWATALLALGVWLAALGLATRILYLESLVPELEDARRRRKARAAAQAASVAAAPEAAPEAGPGLELSPADPAALAALLTLAPAAAD